MSDGEADAGAAPLDLTEDEVLRGRLSLLQPRIGYRFSLDPLLLADFIGAPPHGRVADLGAGCGVVGLVLGRADPAAQVTLVELQPRLAQLCRDNARKNGLADRITVVEGDLLDRALRRQLAGASFDLVASCPPYYPLGRGGVNPTSEEAIARHELRLPLPALVQAARRLVGFRGRVAFVDPSPRLGELLAGLAAAGLQPVRLRLVYPRPGEPAQRAIVEARKGARGDLVIEPPFYVRDPEGRYTPEAQRALGEA
jgi:tRNA1Val (adenine37-N6)-methyltransferase